mmetsp:Transcript_42378/g.111626  ORF Transcript_42378/g.111626 Transcript_42378/m.111626 type:complete len:289 (-) Transcript_42378:269-1135(-)
MLTSASGGAFLGGDVPSRPRCWTEDCAACVAANGTGPLALVAPISPMDGYTVSRIGDNVTWCRTSFGGDLLRWCASRATRAGGGGGARRGTGERLRGRAVIRMTSTCGKAGRWLSGGGVKLRDGDRGLCFELRRGGGDSAAGADAGAPAGAVKVTHCTGAGMASGEGDLGGVRAGASSILSQTAIIWLASGNREVKPTADITCKNSSSCIRRTLLQNSWNRLVRSIASAYNRLNTFPRFRTTRSRPVAATISFSSSAETPRALRRSTRSPTLSSSSVMHALRALTSVS